MKKPIIVLTGPTAVGKTELSIRLAKAVDGEIISADSMQVYKKMDIGTAKITVEEMQGVPHVLVDEMQPDEEFNVTIFKNRAAEAIKDMHRRGKIPILTGGTGFYIQSVLYDIEFTEDENDYQYRVNLMKEAEEVGNHVLWERLKEIDPESAASIHENNVKRVIRALEYYHLTGEKISKHNKQQREKESPYNVLYFVLTMERSVLYKRIDKRVDKMLKDGLVDEVRALKEAGYSNQLVSMQGLGYKEIYDYLEGNITLEDAIYLIKRDTRHFAKRQLTWFKREKDVIWIEKSETEDVTETLNKLLKYCKKKWGDLDER